jgi:hypothetical protein
VPIDDYRRASSDALNDCVVGSRSDQFDEYDVFRQELINSNEDSEFVLPLDALHGPVNERVARKSASPASPSL